MFNFLTKEEIKISTGNLELNEILEYLEFWEKRKYINVKTFVKELHSFIKEHKNFENCKIDINGNEIGLYRNLF